MKKSKKKFLRTSLLKTINQVIAKIRNRGDLKLDNLDYLVMKDPKFARLLPKIHKRSHNVSSRTVMSNSGYYTANISTFLDHQLQPLA